MLLTYSKWWPPLTYQKSEFNFWISISYLFISSFNRVFGRLHGLIRGCIPFMSFLLIQFYLYFQTTCLLRGRVKGQEHAYIAAKSLGRNGSSVVTWEYTLERNLTDVNFVADNSIRITALKAIMLSISKRWTWIKISVVWEFWRQTF